MPRKPAPEKKPTPAPDSPAARKAVRDHQDVTPNFKTAKPPKERR